MRDLNSSPHLSESVSRLGHELKEATFNAKDAEAFAKVRKGKPFSAFLCE
jgi:hypothetical protein